MENTFKVAYMLLLLLAISAQIQTFQKVRFVRDSRKNGIIYDSMYSKSAFPGKKEASSISYYLKIETSQPTQLAFVVIGHRDHFLDIEDLNSDLFSCNNKMRKIENKNENYEKIPINFKGTNSAEIRGTFEVVKSGLYSAVFVPCGDGITVTGQLRFKNPFGYGSGHTYNYFKFYENVILVYLIIAIVWAIMVKDNWSYMYIHQHFITAIILATILDSVYNYLEYYHVNNEGEKSIILCFFVMMFSVCRKTFTRLIVLLISCGYGINEFKLTQLRSLSFSVIITYFVAFNFIRELLRFHSRFVYEGSSGFFTFLFHTVIYLMDFLYYLCTFYELHLTLKSLKFKEKYYQRLYKSFRIVLYFSFVTSIIFCYLEISFTHFSILLPKNWPYFWWYESGVWMVQYTIVLICTMYLWRPNKRLEYKKLFDIENQAEVVFDLPSRSTAAQDEIFRNKQNEVESEEIDEVGSGKDSEKAKKDENCKNDKKNEKNDKRDESNQKDKKDSSKDLLEKEPIKKENSESLLEGDK